ncbi:YbgA family protein [Salinicoccus bachuensis]|uniref:YbgA family protein n=1 Tax=Salinicoccus bachuensis TaxID=3136731 RepID=A0ABZ3CJ12_9STAP
MKERERTEQLWVREKYRVMFHSQKHYNEIREALKGESSYEEAEALVNDALEVQPTKGSMMNAIDHMWGYFRDVCDEEERAEYKRLKEEFLQGRAAPETLLAFIGSLAEKYKRQYLLRSSIIEMHK